MWRDKHFPLGKWIVFKEAVSPDGHLRLPERSFLFSKIICFTSDEQSLTWIELLWKRILVISEQTKSLSKPRKDGFIAALNLFTSSSFTVATDPEGMSPDRTILSDSFFFEKSGECGLLEETEAAAIA